MKNNHSGSKSSIAAKLDLLKLCNTKPQFTCKTDDVQCRESEKEMLIKNKYKNLKLERMAYDNDDAVWLDDEYIMNIANQYFPDGRGQYAYTYPLCFQQSPKSIKNDYGRIYSETNLIDITKSSGKMKNMFSISTNPLTNTFCRTMAQQKNKDIICKYCYSLNSVKRQPSSVLGWERNSLILPYFLLSLRDIPYTDIDCVRFSSEGELINEMHFINICRICAANPNTVFTLFSKRIDIINEILDIQNLPKPSNMILIYSNPKLNDISPETRIKLGYNKYKYFDKCFTVYTSVESLEQSTCNGKRCNIRDFNCPQVCRDCMKCYKLNDKHQYIRECAKKGEGKTKVCPMYEVDVEVNIAETPTFISAIWREFVKETLLREQLKSYYSQIELVYEILIEIYGIYGESIYEGICINKKYIGNKSQLVDYIKGLEEILDEFIYIYNEKSLRPDYYKKIKDMTDVNGKNIGKNKLKGMREDDEELGISAAVALLNDVSKSPDIDNYSAYFDHIQSQGIDLGDVLTESEYKNYRNVINDPRKGYDFIKNNLL